MRGFTRFTGALAGAALLLVSAAPALAGSLSPPPGPIQPTSRVTINPQAIALPFVINNPGSYVLTGDLINTGGAPNALVVQVPGVTIDLNGFVIDGFGGAGDAILVNAGDTVITNGHIRNWQGAGVNAQSFSFPNRIESLSIRDCQRGVIAVHAIISDVNVARCEFEGIVALAASTVTDCLVRECGLSGGPGYFGDLGTIFRNCTALENASDGFNGVIGCVFENCTAKLNGVSTGSGNGFFVDLGGVIRGCASSENAGNGYEAFEGVLIESSTALNNFVSGFRVENSHINNCSATSNQQSGIEGGFGNTITNNSSRNNQRDQILIIGEDNRVSGNDCKSPLGAGLLSISVIAPNNTIFSNSCTNGAPDYSIVAGNDVAPISPAAAAASAIFNVVY
jgi:hypothetical protein